MANKPLVYLVRHGATNANRARRYEGRGDSALSAVGVGQAHRLAAVLADKGIAAVYSSPKLRALDTAKIISAEIGLTPTSLPGLAEVDFGEWEGLTFEEIQGRNPKEVEQWIACPLLFRPPGGESLSEMWKRVHACLVTRVLGDWHSSRTGSVIVVSHGGPIRAILSFVACGDLSAFQQMTIGQGEFTAISLDQLERMQSS